MHLIFDLNWLSAHATHGMILLLDAALKSLVVLGAAALSVVLLPRLSAATRHLIWFVALAGALFLPALSLLLPAWRAPIILKLTRPAPNIANEFYAGGVDPSSSVIPMPAPNAASLDSPEPAGTRARVEEVSVKPTATALNIDSKSADKRPNYDRSSALAAGVVTAWAVGALMACVPVLIGLAGLIRLNRQSRLNADEDWAGTVRNICGELGLNRPVQLRQSDRATMPLTWGFWRPVVLLPAEADVWPADRKRIVLLHELAHIKRADCLTQHIAWFACALYWFNPLVWVAIRQLRRERELACDDLVLNTGAKASDYANHLLEIARTLQASMFSTMAAVAMARRSQFGHRLLVILDAHRNRQALSRKAAAILASALVCALLPIAACKPTSETQVASKAEALAKKEQWEKDQRISKMVERLNRLRLETDRLAAEMEKTDNALQNYRIENQIVSFEENENTLLQSWRQAQLDYDQAKSGAILAKTLVIQIEQQIEKGQSYDIIPQILNNPLIQSFKKSIVEREATVARMKPGRSDAHPDMVSAQAEIAQLKASLQKEGQNVFESLKVEAELAQTKADRLEKEILSKKEEQFHFSRKKIQYDVLKRKAEETKELYHAVAQRAQAIDLQMKTDF